MNGKKTIDKISSFLKKLVTDIVYKELCRSSFAFCYAYSLIITLVYFFKFTKVSLGVILSPFIISSIWITICIIACFILYVIDWAKSLKKKEANND